MPSSTLTLTAAAGSSSFFFTNLSEALVEGGNYAQANAPDEIVEIAYGVFNTDAAQVIPQNALILGVEITAIARISSPFYPSLKNDAKIDQTVQSFVPSRGTLTDTFSTYIFGSPTDNQGITSNIKLQVLTVAIGVVDVGLYSQLDYVSVKVYWELPPSNVLFLGESF